jgi:hypothetical protein
MSMFACHDTSCDVCISFTQDNIDPVEVSQKVFTEESHTLHIMINILLGTILVSD